MGGAPVFASVGEAMEMVQAGLSYLAAADAAQLADEIQAECLRGLYPIHPLQVTAMGMLAADSLQLEDVARACAEEGRFEFMVVGLPLRLPGGTGSPWNPIAIF